VADALHGEHHYSKHFAALGAVALHFLNGERSFFEFQMTARGLAQLCAYEDKRPRRNPVHYLSRAWEGAEKYASNNPKKWQGREGLEALTADIRAAADADTWARQSGNSTRLTLEGVLVLALEQSTATPTLSVRVLSERTGVSKSATARALGTLVERGYLKKALPAKQEKAATYHLEPKERTNWDTGCNPYGVESVSHLVPSLTELMGSDAFDTSALGPSALRVLAVLSELDGQTPEQIRARLGFRSVVTVRRALQALEATGLAMRKRLGRGFTWTSRLDALDLVGIAEAYGTAGKAEKRALNHAREREGFTEFLNSQPRNGIYRPLSKEESRTRAVEKFHRKRAERLSA